MISGTITDASGPHAVGPDRGSVLELGAPRAAARRRPELRARREGAAARTSRSSRGSPRCTSPAIPTPGLPNAFGEYDDTPESMAARDRRMGAERLAQHRRRLLRHHAGAHPRDRRSAAQASRRARPATRRAALRLSGLEPLNIDDDSLFVNVGERTNVTGSKAFARLVLAGDYAGALAVARQQVENGAQVIDVNMDEAMLDSEQAMTHLPQPGRRRAGHLARAGHDRQLQVERDRGGPEVRAGQVRSSTRSP